MRTTHKSLIIATISVVLFSASIADGQNLLITDYHTTVSSARSCLIGANYNFTTEGDEITTNRGDVNLVYKSFYESQPYARHFDLKWSANRNLDGNYFNADLTWRIKGYVPGGSRFFASSALHGVYVKGYERPASDLTVGVGFGRFTRVTPLVMAVRIEDYLLESGQLYDDLDSETMIALGQEIEKKWAYKTIYGESYKVEWYKSMSDIIARSGMLKSGKIRPEGILRMDDVLFRERFSDRFYGWDITLGVKSELVTPKSNIEKNPLAADMTIRYSYPMSWRTQVNEQITFNTPLEKLMDSYNLFVSTDISYEVTNRVDLVFHHMLTREKRVDQMSILTHNNIDVSFIFYLENRVNLTVNLHLAKSSDMEAIHTFTSTFNYRIF